MTDIDTLAEAVVQRLTAHCGDFYQSGMGLALNPTPHQFRLNGHTLYTRYPSIP
jgi:hypothetical protein